MTAPRLLLLAGAPPSTTNVAGLWVHDICDLYPPQSLSVVSRQIDNSGLEASFPFAHTPFSFPSDASPWFVRPFIKVRNRLLTSPALVKKILELGHAHQTELVLAVLHDRTMIDIAPIIARKLNAPLVSLVWDPPEYVHYRDAKAIEKFYEAIDYSRSAIVMSEAMAERYGKNQRTQTIIMQRGIPREYWNEGSKDSNEGEAPLTIGFAGSIYASSEFECLVKALDGVKWMLEGRRIQVSVLSQPTEKVVFESANIKYLGWQATQETIALLSRADVLYLPYAFTERFRSAAYYSFPTKLSTYLAACVPVLYHGPHDSSVRRFIEAYPVGIGCYTNEPNDILSALRRLLLDFEVRRQAVEAILERRPNMIEPDVFRRKFAQALQIDAADLN